MILGHSRPMYYLNGGLDVTRCHFFQVGYVVIKAYWVE